MGGRGKAWFRGVVLSTLSLSLATPRTAQAGLYGLVSTTSQLSGMTSEGSAPSLQATLAELGMLRGSFLPFGAAALLLDGGVALARYDGFGASRYGAFSAGWDLTASLLPLRSLPVSVYGSGLHTRGALGYGALGSGARDRYTYGGRLRFDESTYLPSVRAQFEEQRAFDLVALGGRNEIRRTTTAGLTKRVGDVQLDTSFRREDADWGADYGYRRHTLSVSATHAAFQTQFSGFEVRAVVPSAPVREELSGTLSHRQIYAPWVRGTHGGALSSVNVGDIRGLRKEVASGLTFKPLATRELMFDVDGGFTQVDVTGGSQTATREGHVGARTSYVLPIDSDRLLFAVGGGFSRADGNLGFTGNNTSANGLVGGQLARFRRVRAQASYTLFGYVADVGRGGNRLEHDARATLTVEPVDHLTLNVLGSYVDVMRELVDLTTGQGRRLRDRSISTSVMANTQIQRVNVHADAGYRRGSSLVTLGNLLVDDLGERDTVSAGGGVGSSPVYGLMMDSRAGVVFSMQKGSAPQLVVLARAGAHYRIGLLSIDLDYSFQWNRTALSSINSLHQVMLGLSRPFEVPL